ncbi:MAG TPA: protein phosphatase 2C domain-containing protein [Candidatus Udaeobacter sp.]|nr:protein phosphatase 2C domain-containing protein [Candidatus Udaeobacter sp.]
MPERFNDGPPSERGPVEPKRIIRFADLLPAEIESDKASSKVNRAPRFIFEYVPTEVQTEGALVTPEVNVQENFEVETTRFNGGAFIRMPSALDSSSKSLLKNCQDAGALHLGKDGKMINFAMGDGVSQSMNGKAAAEMATSVALEELVATAGIAHNNLTMRSLIQKVEQRMQAGDLDALKEQWAQDILINKNISPGILRSALLADLGYQENNGVLEKTKAPAKDKKLGSTTLMVGQLENNHLKLAYSSDGGFIVVNSKGVKMFSGQHAIIKSPPQLRLAGDKIDINAIQYTDIELDKGDKVLVYSDGLYHTKKGGEVSSEARAKQVADLVKQGNAVEQIAKTLMQDAAGMDDIEVLAFEY